MRQLVAVARAPDCASFPRMLLTARSCLALLALASSFVVVACDDDDDVSNGGDAAGAGGEAAGGSGNGGNGGSSGHATASLQCEVLGELCHAADTGSGPASDCHDLGHVGDATVCAAEFDGCIATCTDKEIGPNANDAKCIALGSLCHPAGEVDAEAEACHALGHDGVAADCAEKFDECAALCLAVLETLEHGGAGGAAHGGAGGAAHGGAGGAAHGGAGGAGGADAGGAGAAAE